MNINLSMAASDNLSTSDHATEHRIKVLSFNFDAVMEPFTFTFVVLIAGLSKIGFHHANFLSSKIPESCLLIILGTLFGALIHFCKISSPFMELFEPHKFFLFLLPPVILESSFSLHDRAFFDNFGTILLFAVVMLSSEGTILSCFLIGFSLYGLIYIGAMGHIVHMSLIQILIFSALIVAVDPVAVLAVFSKIGINDALYFIIFGESLLNDGVTVVLYQVMQTFNLMSTIETNQVVLGFVKFVVVCIGGVFIGLLTGVISAILTRVTVHVGAAMDNGSLVCSMIACGLVQRHYAFPNISDKSRITVKYFTKVLASVSEIIIFFFLGLELVKEKHDWHTLFVIWSIVLCTLFRFLITFGIASLINRYDNIRVRSITFKEMFIIAFGGLRGAVAFSLAALLHVEELPMRRMFITTTLAVVMFTVFFQGITIGPLVQMLSIKLAPEKNRSMYCELNNHVTDHLLAGIEDVVGIHGKNYIRERLGVIDQCYFRKWLMNQPEHGDLSLHDFYRKIVIKEHYTNLKICRAANVSEPQNIPRIDTRMYLDTTEVDMDEEVPDSETDTKDHSIVHFLPSVADDNGGGRGLVIRQFSKRSVKSPVRNWQNLRNLLTKSRDLHLAVHSSYDRNLTGDQTNNLNHQVVLRSAQNNRLKHLMSSAEPTVMSHSTSTCVDTSVSMSHRDTTAADLSKQSISLGLDDQSASYWSCDAFPSSASAAIRAHLLHPAVEVHMETIPTELSENDSTDGTDNAKPLSMYAADTPDIDVQPHQDECMSGHSSLNKPIETSVL